MKSYSAPTLVSVDINSKLAIDVNGTIVELVATKSVKGSARGRWSFELAEKTTLSELISAYGEEKLMTLIRGAFKHKLFYLFSKATTEGKLDINRFKLYVTMLSYRSVSDNVFYKSITALLDLAASVDSEKERMEIVNRIITVRQQLKSLKQYKT